MKTSHTSHVLAMLWLVRSSCYCVARDEHVSSTAVLKLDVMLTENYQSAAKMAVSA